MEQGNVFPRIIGTRRFETWQHKGGAAKKGGKTNASSDVDRGQHASRILELSHPDIGSRFSGQHV